MHGRVQVQYAHGELCTQEGRRKFKGKIHFKICVLSIMLNSLCCNDD